MGFRVQEPPMLGAVGLIGLRSGLRVYGFWFKGLLKLGGPVAFTLLFGSGFSYQVTDHKKGTLFRPMVAGLPVRGCGEYAFKQGNCICSPKSSEHLTLDTNTP